MTMTVYVSWHGGSRYYRTSGGTHQVFRLTLKAECEYGWGNVSGNEPPVQNIKGEATQGPQSKQGKATALLNQGAISYMSNEAFGVVERSGLGDVEPARGLGAGR